VGGSGCCSEKQLLQKEKLLREERQTKGEIISTWSSYLDGQLPHSKQSQNIGGEPQKHTTSLYLVLKKIH
jgi:hypothetical protein